jgi:hypothetical protein
VLISTHAQQEHTISKAQPAQQEGMVSNAQVAQQHILEHWQQKPLQTVCLGVVHI